MAEHGKASMSIGQFRELSGMVIRCLPGDMDPSVAQGWIDNPESLRKALREALTPAAKGHVIDLDADPFCPNGWTVEKHVKGGKIEWDPARVALYLPEAQRGGKAIQGTQLRKELEGKLAYNANLLDYLLAHPELIPQEWKDKAVFFWGTIYRNPDGGLSVRYLYWYGGRWYWFFHWLDYDFGSSNPAAVPASI
ncbi:MAG: hypothetical protein Q8P39_02690 [Candidatus Yanofskybacteria bacterium]|nr:hypothetical protein [Candidatus Yanofskybacteria bacterium]